MTDAFTFINCNDKNYYYAIDIIIGVDIYILCICSLFKATLLKKDRKKPIGQTVTTTNCKSVVFKTKVDILGTIIVDN